MMSFQKAMPNSTRAASGARNLLRYSGTRGFPRRCDRVRQASTAAAATDLNAAYHSPPAVQELGNAASRKGLIKNAKPFSEFLTDKFNRQHDYLRISITERCNLRCLYCMPEEGIQLSPPAHLLTTPEIFYLSSLFVSQGVTKIRLTGGEPTVRKDVVPLMQQIGTLRPKGLKELALTTNGISLHRKLDAMVEAGLTGINLSLDTLDPFQFQIMTRRKGFDAVMRSIDRILDMKRLGANIKLKINCVVMRGLNEREIVPFVEMGREKDIEVRFIEYMPFGGNKWSKGKMLSYEEMLEMIRSKYPEIHRIPGHKNDTSKTYQVPGFLGKVGFITSMTEDFCGTCNRLRITGDGNLKVCLHGNTEVSLRDILREGNGGKPIDEAAFEALRELEMSRQSNLLSDATPLGWGPRERQLLDIIGKAVKRKKEKHAGMGELENMENRPMILIDKSNRISSPSNALATPNHRRTMLYQISRPLPQESPRQSTSTFLLSQNSHTLAFEQIRTYSTSSGNAEIHNQGPEKPPTPFIKVRNRALQNMIRQQLKGNKEEPTKVAPIEAINPPMTPQFHKLKDAQRRARQRLKKKDALLEELVNGKGSADEMQYPSTSQASSETIEATTEAETNASEANEAKSRPDRWRKSSIEALLRSEGLLKQRRAGNGAQMLARKRRRQRARESHQRAELESQEKSLERQRSFFEQKEGNLNAVREKVNFKASGNSERIENWDRDVGFNHKETGSSSLEPSFEETRVKEVMEDDGMSMSSMPGVEDDSESWVSGSTHVHDTTATTIRPRSATEISKYALAKALQFGGHSSRIKLRPRAASDDFGGPANGKRTLAGANRQVGATTFLAASGRRNFHSEVGSAPQVGDIQLQTSQEASTIGERLYIRRKEQLQTIKLNQDSGAPDKDLAIQVQANDTATLIKEQGPLNTEDYYGAFIYPFQAKYPLNDFRLGPRRLDNANPKKDLLRQLRFLERRFDPAFSFLKALVPKWRQEIWQVAIGLREIEVAKIGQLTILKESLGRAVQDSIHRRSQGRPRLRDDPLWESIVLNEWAKRESLASFGLSEDEAAVWWHTRKKFRAHIERETPMRDTKRRLQRFLADTENEEEERNRLLNYHLSRGEHLLNEWDDIARNLHREMWMFAMGVDSTNEELRHIVRKEFGIDMPDVRAAMKYWNDAKHYGLPRPKAWARSHLLKMKEKLRNGKHTEAEEHAKVTHALRRADGRILGTNAATNSLPVPTDMYLKSNMDGTNKTPEAYLSHTEYRALQRLTVAERTVDKLVHQVQSWRRELYTTLTGISFDGPKIHQYISSGFLAAAVETYKRNRGLQRPVGNESTQGSATDNLRSLQRGYHHVRTTIRRRAHARLARRKEQPQRVERVEKLESAQQPTKATLKPSSDRKSNSNNTGMKPRYLRRLYKGQRRYAVRLRKHEQGQSLGDEFYELPHEFEMGGKPGKPLIVPTSKLLAPLKRIPDIDELPLKEEVKSGKKLTHLKSTGEAHMVSVSAKPDTKRTAIAVGEVRFSNAETYELVKAATLKKGDVLGISRIAGIQAAKLCPSIIPLCHPIMISSVSVEVEPFEDTKGTGIRIEGKVECTGPTGVEMEALTAVMGASLTVIDMVKAVDKAASVQGVRVVYKSGGKSGNWIDEEWSSSKKEV